MKISMIPNKIVKLIHASKGDTSLRKWAFEPYDNNGAINVSNIKDQLVYKTENGGTEQLLPVNASTPTTSYFDGTINYGTDTDVEFTYKQSSYTGQARIKSIKGNTLVWNQLMQNGNFADASGWIVQGQATINSVSNNIMNFTASANGGGVQHLVPVINGHKYLAMFDYISQEPLRCNIAGAGTFYIDSSTSWAKASGFITWTSTTSSWFFRVISSANSDFSPIQIKNCMVIDITQLGLDITDPSDFTSLFPLPYYAYNQGTLLSFVGSGIKTTGKNLLDLNDLQIGKNWTYGSASDRAIIEFDVQPSTEYTLEIDNTTIFPQILLVYKTGYNSAQISNENIYLSTSFNFTTPSTCNVLCVQFAKTDVSASDFYGKYVCCLKGTTSTLSLPISTYFPTGMKSAGSVYDELSDKAITRVGSVDLGTLTWTRQSTGVGGKYRFTTSLSPSAKASDTTRGVRSICSHYKLLAQGGTGSATTTGYTIADYSNPFIYDEQYATATAEQFKTAMSGVYLNYELATYTETDIQNASLVCKNIEVPCYLSNGNLVCDATEELTNESGFFDAKLKIKDSSSVAYSSKFKLHVEDL